MSPAIYFTGKQKASPVGLAYYYGYAIALTCCGAGYL